MVVARGQSTTLVSIWRNGRDQSEARTLAPAKRAIAARGRNR
jgi:hypothetical protein